MRGMKQPGTLYDVASRGAACLLVATVVWRLVLGPVPSLLVAALLATLLASFVLGVYTSGLKRVEDEHERRRAERRRRNSLPNS